MITYPNQCYIELTQRCNLKCVHCFAKGSQNANLPEIQFSDLKKVVSQLEKLGIYTVNISGGEPTLHNNFFEIIEYLLKFPFRYSILTNGLNWSDEHFRKLCEIDPDRKLKIQISVDGSFDNMKAMRGINKQEYILLHHNINEFVSLGFSVGVLYVANLLTIKDSLNVAHELLFSYNVKGVKIVPMFESGRAIKMKENIFAFWDEWSKLVLSVTDIKKHRKWGAKTTKLSLGIFNLYELVVPLDDAGRHQDIEDVWKLNVNNIELFRKQSNRFHYCEVGFSELVISSDMKLLPCVAGIRTNQIIGDLRKESLLKLWENSDLLNWYRNDLVSVTEQQPCSDCNYKELCSGGCRLNAMSASLSKYEPDPRCPLVLRYNKEVRNEL